MTRALTMLAVLAVAVAVVGGIGVVGDGGGVGTVTVAAVVIVVVETRGRRGVSDVGGGSSEVKVEGVLLAFERKALRLIGAFGAVLKNGRKILRLGQPSRGTARPSKFCVPIAVENTCQ